MIQRSLTSFGSLLLMLLSLLLCFSAFIFYNNSISKGVVAKAQLNTITPFAKNYTNLYAGHLFGAFSVDTPAEASAAFSDGIQYTIHYGVPHSPTSTQGLALQKAGIKEYDSHILSFLDDYECHRALITKNTQYCTTEPSSHLTSATAVLGAAKSYLLENQNNSLIAGHWILDDWPDWDDGSAKQLLVGIHQLIRQYTPNIPAICGFGAEFSLKGEVSWHDATASNFSSQACDEIGLYIYAAPADKTNNLPKSDDYDWSMSKVLPQVAKSLQTRGWDSHKTPWIGIGQAFGGVRSSDNSVISIAPSIHNMITQALSFCKAGAKDIMWYAYDQGSYYVSGTEQTPMNNPGIKAGIRSGIAACKAWWSSTAQGPLHR